MKRRQYFIVAVLVLLCIVFASTGSSSLASDTFTDVLPPAPPTAASASLQGTGVELSWTAAEAGSFPVAGYTISKSTDGQNYVDIITSAQTNFTDPEGQVGQKYQIKAIDDQSPPNASLPSDIVEPQPVDTQAPEPAGPSGLNKIDITQLSDQAKADNQNIAASSDNMVVAVNDITNRKLAELSSNLDQDSAKTKLLLDQYVNAKVRLLSNFYALPNAAKQLAVDNCNSQADNIETIVLVLPENLQASAYEALAQCQLITKHND